MQRIKNSEFGYLGNPSVKRDGVETQFTKEEVQEYARCMKDPAYFARKYITKSGKYLYVGVAVLPV